MAWFVAYRDALNFASRNAFEFDKSSSAPKIYKAVYSILRERFRLGALLACTAERQVAAAYRIQWTKLKQNQEAQKKGHSKRLYKGLDTVPKFVSSTLEYQYGRDYSWKKDGRVSLGTLDGRTVLKFEGYQKHLDFVTQGAETGSVHPRAVPAGRRRVP
ncbi:hypothetical protein DEDE109153_09530 [Deinococcus deserti]|uniref:hypothetical protein n=1 Tax=Deinococcus deserti TaxID=310783 RepID=UPI0001994FCD|nr:hypothetical protein [Deinococcus deserti]